MTSSLLFAHFRWAEKSRALETIANNGERDAMADEKHCMVWPSK